MTYLVGLALAGGLFLVGVWGRREAGALAPGHLPARDRARRERTLVRGAIACQTTAMAAAVVTLGSMVLQR